MQKEENGKLAATLANANEQIKEFSERVISLKNELDA